MVATITCAVVVAVTKSVVALVFNLGQKRCQLWKGFQDDIDFIKTELSMIAGVEEEQLSQKGEPSVVKSVSMEEMHDLALQIEDCLDRILRYVVEGEKESSLLHRLKAVSGPPPYAAEIKKLKERLKAAHQRKLDYSVNTSQPSTPAGQTTISTSMTLTFPKIEPVGIDESKRELLQLIDDQREELKVISIVGIGGSGKTTLAKAVYDCPRVVCHFPCRAWVVASEHRDDAKGILVALLHELRQGAGDWPARGTVQQLQTHITNYLDTNRYLIVLDDIDEQQWDSIKLTFPEKTRSRIIVTTTVQAVGNICSHGNGYVYNMGTLDVKHSKDLLEAVLKVHLAGLEQSSESIVNKCDGHPLALISVANYLVRKDVLTEKECEQVCRSLGYHMAKEYSFSKLRHVLMDNYSSLSGYLIKICLLYICVFPNGCFINKNSLMRRWLAEGYVKCQHPRSALQVADENFEELINRNVIRPVESSKNARVKTCKAHGIMHEFMLHLSNTAKFITSLNNPERSTYRHLFMDSNSALDVNHNHTSPASVGTSKSDKKFRARSLTICGSAGEAVVEYAKCELLWVLDLEECNDLKDDHMNDIHKLWHLKYLSLGATISRLPSKIEKLHCLETLDTRKTKIDTLPAEVFKLPYLAHLLGKFKLGKRDFRASEVHKFLPKESNMQTLAGFVTDSNPGFPLIMAQMRKLRKVKIWCSPGDSERSLADLSAAIKKFMQYELRTGVGVRSLSLHLGNSSVNSILHFLESSYGYLSSLKLHGELSGQTQLVTLLRGLTELCLSSTNNLTSNDLSNLRKFKHLKYVKLVNVSLGEFIIRRQDFRGLLRLCLVQCPTLPTVEEGAIAKLISLHLLCENLVGLAGINIEQHKQIQEVALDSMASPETAAAWEDAAKKHPKRPRVLFFRKVCSNESGSMVKYVATERPSPEIESSVMEEEGQSPAVQPISVDELSSALKDLNVAGPSMASSELPTMMNNVMPCSSRVVS
ncbi:hypothetical protein BS78_K313900 [Paspalum vaginatum]|uniref:NB-ARC domain-containing protein n=1 Tax=Paspalum vaginatum TaxID=158149 RepID=A0A9W7XDX6_9POAL|nr:hypothetical protein BS78_K313900 [Paspalum vaginatum]